MAISVFHSSAFERDELAIVMADYLALERVRIYRRLLVARCGALALLLSVIGIGLRWLPPLAAWTSVGLCMTPPVWAWIVELRHDRRLTRRLSTPVGDGKKVIKRS